MKKSSATVLVLLILFSGFAFAQSDGDRPSTIEDVFLRQQIEMQILASQARSTERENKLVALETVRKMYESGDLQASPETFAIIELLATEGTSNQVRQSGRVINNYPVVRKEAAALLGDVGGPQAQSVLLVMVREDPEPMVLAEAVYALGKIGPQENADMVANHIVFTLTRENAKISPDNNLALATLLALQRLFDAGMEFEDANQLRDTVGLIIDISTNYRYITIVRERARDVLAQLTSTN
ncbi:MAG TPA: HEAT repeat domain-containing protein [Spirochaetia bacterium]|nr:HEAT repeat domain-containing protein [Spirochaetia bacterium]